MSDEMGELRAEFLKRFNSLARPSGRVLRQDQHLLELRKGEDSASALFRLHMPDQGYITVFVYDWGAHTDEHRWGTRSALEEMALPVMRKHMVLDDLANV